MNVIQYNPSQLPDIEAVEIINLKGIDADRASLYMQEANSASAEYVRLTGDAAQTAVYLFRQLPPGSQMRCHIPPYGLRFYQNGSLLLQASICWKCNNIFGDGGGKQFFCEFDAEHSISQSLLNICKQAFD